MAVDGSDELSLVHLGVVAPVEGNPDGHFHGNASVVHDASGGLAVVRLTASTLGEVLLRFDRITVSEELGVNTTGQHQLQFQSPDEMYGTDVMNLQGGVIAAALSAERIIGYEYPGNGLWYWVTKGTTTVIRMTTDNVNGAATALQCMGWYWRMTRLRMHGPKDWRRQTGGASPTTPGFYPGR